MTRSLLHGLVALGVVLSVSCQESVEVANPSRQFPAGFLFGTATSAHQVEGNLVNDFWQWEQIAPDADGKCRIRECQKTSDPTPAADWGRGRYDEDFARAESMGNNTIRVGFEWARIEPYPGVISADGVKFYHDMLASMKKHGLKPMVTVSHFTLPVWMQYVEDKGNGSYAVAATAGWHNPDIAKKYGVFAVFLAKEYGGEVDYWCTINEPWGELLGGYLGGVFPPGRFLDFPAVLKALGNMLRAHAAIYHALKKYDGKDADGDGVNSYVGLVMHDRISLPAHVGNERETKAAERANYIFADMVNNAVITGKADLDVDGTPETEIEGLAGTTDYWGVNYYGIFLYDSVVSLPPYLDGFPIGNAERAGYATNDLGWALYPEGFRERLNYYWKKWGNVGGKRRFLMIAENGVADSQDKLRAKFIVEHLDVLQKTIVEDGVDVRGYYHWSLVDNFEWHEGYVAHFGLYRLDPATQKRTETAGARVYRAVIKANAVTPVIREEFASGDYPAPKRLEGGY